MSKTKSRGAGAGREQHSRQKGLAGSLRLPCPVEEEGVERQAGEVRGPCLQGIVDLVRALGLQPEGKGASQMAVGRAVTLWLLHFRRFPLAVI